MQTALKILIRSVFFSMALSEWYRWYIPWIAPGNRLIEQF